MALTSTTLTAPISERKLQNIALASTAGFAAGQPVRIDNEYMYCVSVIPGFGITVRMRGAESAAVPHDVNAIVLTSSNPNDFPTVPTGNAGPVPPSFDDVVTLGQDVTLTPPAKNTTYFIAKPTAIAITLLSGTPAAAGITMTFISTTAAAHVITYAAGFLGSANTVATFASSINAALETRVTSTGKVAALASPSITFSA